MIGLIDEPCSCLLVEDDAEDAALVKKHLEAVRSRGFNLEHVTSLRSAVAKLRSAEFDAVLLDLQLPDGCGIDSVDYLKACWPTGAIIVLTGLEDEVMALDAVRHGAQDYVTKDTLSGELLLRTIRYAIERQRFAYWVSATNVAKTDAVASFCESLRDPIAELLNCASDVSSRVSSRDASDIQAIEQLRAVASRVVTMVKLGLSESNYCDEQCNLPV